METVEFNAENHSYKIGDKNPPSVTKILPDIPEHLLYNQNFIKKTIIGTDTHAYAEQANTAYKEEDRILLPDFVTEDALPYCSAYLNFLCDIRPEIYDIESRLYHSVYEYAGTLDLVCSYMKKRTLFDIKTTSLIKATVRLQTAAYFFAYNYDKKRSEQAERRGIIWLKPNGSYLVKLLPIKYLKYDFNVFLCKLKSFKWDLQNL